MAADAHAKPIAVFPGMMPSNGSAMPWKKKTLDTSSNSTPVSSRPTSTIGNKAAPPPIAAKPKPAPPPVGSKPKIPGKPPIPSAPRPVSGVPPPPPPPPAPPRPGVGGVKAPEAAPGQTSLAALVCSFSFFLNTKSVLMQFILQLAKRAQRMADDDD